MIYVSTLVAIARARIHAYAYARERESAVSTNEIKGQTDLRREIFSTGRLFMKTGNAPWARGGTARFEVFRETTRQNSRGESGAGLLLPPEITEVNTASTVLPLPKNSQRPAAAHLCKRGSAQRRHEEQAEKPSVELSESSRTGSRISRRSAMPGEKRYPATKQGVVIRR